MWNEKMMLLKSSIGSVLLLATLLFSQGLIIDHTSVQKFEQIPDQWLNAAKKLTIHYAHTSHGMQIISGLKYISEKIDQEKYRISYITYYADHPDPTTALPAEQNPPALRIADTGRKPEGYWSTEEGLKETKSFAATGLFNYSMFGWCGELSGSLDLKQYIDDYLNALDQLEKEYPNMRFIYFTAPTDGFPAYSKLRQNNEQIRKYCIDHNKILYDFADIESWDPDGNFYTDNYSCSWCEDWCKKHPDECVDLPPDMNSGIPTCCPHSHGYNCLIKGKSYWYMMARLAGWDGSIAVPVELLKFYGQLYEKGVKLIWQTASEKNNYGFEIERCFQDSQRYEKIGFVFGSGTTVEINEYSFIDEEMQSGIHHYRLKQIDNDGGFKYLGDIRIIVELSNNFTLYPNYPNPFNSTTVISYFLRQSNFVKLSIYNIANHEVMELVHEFQKPGSYALRLNAKSFPSGLYYCCLSSGDLCSTQKMLIIK